MDQGYIVNIKSVAHETIDNEVVIVNLDTGAYFSIDDTGADVWNLLAQGATGDQIVSWLDEYYDGEQEAIAASVEKLIAELAAESLVVTAETNGTPLLEKTGSANTPFVEPVLHKYTDMEDLLLLDPIHEVTDEGWPNAN